MRNCALSSLLLSHLDCDISTSVSQPTSKSEVVFFAIVSILARCTEFPVALSQSLAPLSQWFVAVCLLFSQLFIRSILPIYNLVFCIVARFFVLYFYHEFATLLPPLVV